jgi:hypothetical protein
MNRLCSFALLIAALTAPVMAQQQQPPPHIGYAFPAGGRQGTTLEVTLGGQSLEGVSAVFFTDPGITGKISEHIKPLSPVEAIALRDKAKELRDRRSAFMGRDRSATSRPATLPTWSEKDEKTLEEIVKKLMTFRPKLSSPAIAETVKLDVNLGPSVKAGQYALRLLTPQGITNPIFFEVGTLPEIVEIESRTSAAATETRIPLPASINGQIMPGDVDRYRFKAKKGQDIVAAVSARQLIPYIADAVPGWFQATVALYDDSGRQLTFSDGFQVRPDPLLHYVIPADGEYVIEIRDTLYRGREDFVYRITLGGVPWITGVFPLGGQSGRQSTLQLTGLNLPASTAALDARELRPGIHTLAEGPHVSIDALPEVLEKEPNDSPEAAQAVSMPLIINGRIDHPGDTDVFKIEGRAGEPVIVEVMARRLDSPLDSLLQVTDAAGKQLALNDDFTDKGAGLSTHHADSFLMLRLPADGTYYVQICDTQNRGGESYAYRLRLSGPRPDFELRVVPSSISARGGTSVPITVYAMRRDGFSGPIDVALKDAPKGFELEGARVPAGQDQVRMTLATPPITTPEPVGLSFDGKALIGGRNVVHQAIPAEDMMQAFLYRHLVPMPDTRVAVGGRFMQRRPLQVTSRVPLRLSPGGTAKLEINMPQSTAFGTISFELSDPPEGISLKSASPSQAGTELVIACSAKVKPGLKGNLIIGAFTGPKADDAQGAKGAGRRRQFDTVPAVPFEIGTESASR